MPSKAQPRYRLKTSVRGIDRNSLSRIVGRADFQRYARDVRDKGTAFKDEVYSAAMKGRPVPEEFFSVLVRYLIERPERRADFFGLSVGEVAEPDTDTFLTRPWDILTELGRTFTDVDPLTACGHDGTDPEADVRAAAEHIQRLLPYHFPENAGRSLADADAFAFSERVMGVSREAFGDWAVAAHRFHPATVMWAVRGGWMLPPERVASIITVPLAAAAAREFVGGRKEFFDLDPAADFHIPSVHMLLVCMKERRDPETLADVKCELEVLRTFCYQIGMFSGDVDERANRPEVYAYCGTPQSKPRLESHHFEPLGTRSPVVRHPLYVYRPVRRKGEPHYFGKRVLNTWIDLAQNNILNRAARLD